MNKVVVWVAVGLFAGGIFAADEMSLDEERDGEELALEDTSPAKAVGKITSPKVLLGANAKKFAVLGSYEKEKSVRQDEKDVDIFCAALRGALRPDGLVAAGKPKPTVKACENASVLLALACVYENLPRRYRDAAYVVTSAEDLASALEELQRKNGLWGATPDDPKSADDPAASAVIAAAFAIGAENDAIARGYLDLARRTLATLKGGSGKNPALKVAVPFLEKAIAAADSPLRADGRAKKRRKAGQMQLTPRQRATEGEVAAPGEFRLEPTYACVSVAWGAPARFADGVRFSYRKVGEKSWLPALEPEFYIPWKNYRGSIVNLAEDTEYEVRAEVDGKTQATGRVRTWASKVPVAKTVEIDPKKAKFPIVIKDQAPADGWIRYVPKGGKALVNETKEPTFVVAGAKHVILDGFTIVGGRGFCSIRVDRSAEGVRILNCEISGFGPDSCGAPNGAIYLADYPHEVTIERCFVHSPRGRAQSWRYEHPYGPQAVRVHKPYSTVIRWCDFVGCESRRFDDVIKCEGNDGYHLGFNRNADIQGNFLFCANDDCIELDGGQQNVRFFGNRCEEALMGVSVQCNMTSPSYVFDNAFTGLGTEFGHKVSAIKTASVDVYHYGAVSYFIHNTFCGPGSRDSGALDIGSNWETARLRTYNNLFVGVQQRLKGDNHVKNGRVAGNVATADEAALASVANARLAPVKPSYAEAVPNFSRRVKDGKAVVGAPAASKAVSLPERPIPWALDVGRLEVTMENGAASPKASTFRLACAAAGAGRPPYRAHFRVRTPEFDSGWYSVSPKEGVIESGKTIDFTVTYDPAKANRRHRYAAAFVVRTDDGFGRPVSIHATTDYVAPFKVENPRGKVVYGKRDGGDEKNPEWTFDLPQAGTWFLFIRARHPGASFCDQPEYLTDVTPYLNGVKIPDVDVPVEKWTSWVPLDPTLEGMRGYRIRAAGEQRVKLTGFDRDLAIEGLLFATDPMDIEDAKRE